MTKAKRFENFVRELINAKTDEEATRILYRIDGVDMSFQREEITWEQQNLLFDLAGRLHFEEPEQEEEPEEPEEAETTENQEEPEYTFTAQEITRMAYGIETREEAERFGKWLGRHYLDGGTDPETFDDVMIYLGRRWKV